MGNLRYVPQFRVTISDDPIPAALRASISGLSHQSGLEGADRVELTLVNEQLRWLDHPLLQMDNSLKLEVGYAPDPLKQVFVGNIVAQGASFPSGGAPTVTVTAQDRRQRLQEGSQERWFGFSIPKVGNFPLGPDTVVAAQVSAENQLTPIIEPVGAILSAVLGGVEAISTMSNPGEAQKFIRKQTGSSNFEFLTRIARDNGWEILIDHSEPQGGSKLVFMSPLDRLEPDVTLKYGQSLVEFTPRISTVGQIVAVTVFIWVSQIKTQLSITLGWDWDRMALTLDMGAGPATGRKGASAVSIAEPVSLTSAPRKLVSELIPKLNKRLTGSGSAVGDPRIQAGTVLRLEGLGVQFSGLYRVTSATHTIDGGGYRTRFDVRKEIWFGSIPPAQQGAVPVRVSGHLG